MDTWKSFSWPLWILSFSSIADSSGSVISLLITRPGDEAEELARRLGAVVSGLACTLPETVSGGGYLWPHISNLSGLADFGRKEIAIAEQEMPGLMAIRRKYARSGRSRACASPARCT